MCQSPTGRKIVRFTTIFLPFLEEGKRITPFCDFVKLTTRAQEHTSLTPPKAEDGGFLSQQAQI